MMIITCQCNVSSSEGKDSHEHCSGEWPQRYYTSIEDRSEQGEVLIIPLGLQLTQLGTLRVKCSGCE